MSVARTLAFRHSLKCIAEVLGAIGAQQTDIFGGAYWLMNDRASPAWNSKSSPMGSRGSNRSARMIVASTQVSRRP